MGQGATPTISLIVPVRNEAPSVLAALAEIACLGFCELIVVDSSVSAAAGGAEQPLRTRRIIGAGSRGACLARAVSQARGDAFFFLHADCRPPGDAVEVIRQALGHGASSGAFSLAYANAGLSMRWVAAWANLRSRFLRLSFGDQGLFCSREAYQSAGGFRDMAVCEDVDLVRRLRRTGRFVLRREVVTASPRRYEERGVLRQVLRVWIVLGGYFLGVSPERLGRLYYGGPARGRASEHGGTRATE